MRRLFMHTSLRVPSTFYDPPHHLCLLPLSKLMSILPPITALSDCDSEDFKMKIEFESLTSP